MQMSITSVRNTMRRKEIGKTGLCEKWGVTKKNFFLSFMLFSLPKYFTYNQ